MVYSLTLIPPILIGIYYQDGAIDSFAKVMAMTLLLGTILWYPLRHHKRDLKIRDGIIIVVMFWAGLGAVGSLPLYMEGKHILSLTHAMFESFSGLTTTGATVMTHLDQMPHAILWYRQQTQWLGGMGLIVLAVAILPMLGIGGMQLYRAEMPGPMKDAKLAPRISETAKALWLIYLGLTVICALAFKLAGMNWFDAIGHSFSTIALGGVSTHDASLSYFHNVNIEVIAIIFMFISGINFSLHFTAFRNLSVMHYFHDPEYRLYTLIMTVGMVLTSLYLYHSGTYHSLAEAFRYGSFMAMSIGTTTGFGNTDVSVWPAFPLVLIIFMSIIGGSAGSTGGGVKVIRFLLLFKQGIRELHRLLHPNAISPVKLNNRAIPERVSTAVWGFFSIYVATFAFIMLLLLATGMDQITAFSSVAATITNSSFGIGDVLTKGYADMSNVQLWILIVSMVLGRLEILTLLVMLTRAFWRK